MKLKFLLAIIFSIFLLSNASAVMLTYGDFQNGADSATITNGDSISFNVDFGTTRTPMTLSVKMYDSADTVIQTFDVSSYTNGNSFQKTYTITPSVYLNTGTFEIILNGRDNSGSSMSDSLTLTVNPIPTPVPPTPPTPTNNAPVISSSPVTSVDENTAYSYDVSATDADGNILTYSLTQKPNWLSINSNTGLITGTAPSVSSNSDFSITVRVSDGTAYAEQSYTLTIHDTSIPPTNNAPVITVLGSNPVNIEVGHTYTDAGATATDAEDGTLTSSIIKTGTINTNIVGTYTITYSVTDSNSNTVTKTRIVNVVSPSNHAPVITSSPITSITEGKDYDYDVSATDSDGDTLTYSLTQKPNWLSINSNTGLITGTAPLVNSSTNYNIIVKVSDGNGGIDTQSYIVKVKNHVSGGSGGNSLSPIEDIPCPKAKPSSQNTDKVTVNKTKNYGFSVLFLFYILIALISFGIIIVMFLLGKNIRRK